ALPPAPRRQRLQPFPTRRSSDLPRLGRDAPDTQARAAELGLLLDADGPRAQLSGADRGGVPTRAPPEDCDVGFHHVRSYKPVTRSEEHTSEPQSLRHLVFRPLLE